MKKKAISRETETWTVNKAEKFCSWKWLQVENAVILCHVWTKHCFHVFRKGGEEEVLFLLVFKVYLLFFCWARFWACEKLVPIPLISSAPLVLAEAPMFLGREEGWCPRFLLCVLHATIGWGQVGRGGGVSWKSSSRAYLSWHHIQDSRFICFSIKKSVDFNCPWRNFFYHVACYLLSCRKQGVCCSFWSKNLWKWCRGSFQLADILKMWKENPHVWITSCILSSSICRFGGAILFSSERLAVCLNMLSVKALRGIFNSLKSWVLWITLGEVAYVSSNRWSYHKTVLVCLCRKGSRLVFSKTTKKKKRDNQRSVNFFVVL